MDKDNAISQDNAVYEAGVALGYAFAPFIKGLLDGMEDRKLNEAAAAIELPESEDEPKPKSQIADCEKCLCGWCEKAEACEKRTCVGCVDGRYITDCAEFIRTRDGSFNMG